MSLPDGFYWFLDPPPKNQLYTEDWTIVRVTGGQVEFFGNELGYTFSEMPGTYVPVEPRKEDAVATVLR